MDFKDIKLSSKEKSEFYKNIYYYSGLVKFIK